MTMIHLGDDIGSPVCRANLSPGDFTVDYKFRDDATCETCQQVLVACCIEAQVRLGNVARSGWLDGEPAFVMVRHPPEEEERWLEVVPVVFDEIQRAGWDVWQATQDAKHGKGGGR